MAENIQVYIDPAQIEKIMAIPKEASKRAFVYLVTEVWAGLREEPPIDHGRLRGSWQQQIKVNDFHYKYPSGAEYAADVAFGTGIYGAKGQPYTIKPKVKKALAFVWKGMKIVVKSVKHKGQKPNPFHERAMARGEARVDEFIRRALRETGG